MKNFIARSVVLACAAVLVFTGCKSDEDFRPYVPQAYVIQSGGDALATFLPYFSVINGSSSFNMSSVRVSAPWGSEMDGYFITPNIWETSSSSGTLNIFRPRTEVNGSYNVAAFTEDGESNAQAISVNVAENQVMGELRIDEITYEDGILSANVLPVDKATGYGYIILPAFPRNGSATDIVYSRAVATMTKASEKKVTIGEDDDAEEWIQLTTTVNLSTLLSTYEKVAVRVISFNDSASPMVIQESAGKIIEKE